jgi:protein TonB
MSTLTDAFTVDEIARAAGVPRDAVQALVASGVVRPLPGTTFFATGDALYAGREARRAVRALATSVPGAEPGIFAISRGQTAIGERRGGLPTFASSLVHAVFIVTTLWLTSGPTQTAPVVTATHNRLVFLARPGPGGGGGGGGLRNPLPAPQVETRKARRSLTPVPAVSPDKVPVSARRIETPRPAPKPTPLPVAPEPPLPSRVLIAPVAPAASNRQREGVLEQPRHEADSPGAGTAGGTGTGQGTGNGEGIGAGIGPGSGGGIGGGPYRGGSGIDPPRLVREVKALYTDEARRRGTTGNVVLEIVVNRDGTVGDVSVLRGLGAGLDQRAVEAVRQWTFTPARRQGEAVDVIVEVAVEFTLR